jgi:hypothetical protein
MVRIPHRAAPCTPELQLPLVYRLSSLHFLPNPVPIIHTTAAALSMVFPIHLQRAASPPIAYTHGKPAQRAGRNFAAHVDLTRFSSDRRLRGPGRRSCSFCTRDQRQHAVLHGPWSNLLAARHDTSYVNSEQVLPADADFG